MDNLKANCIKGIDLGSSTVFSHDLLLCSDLSKQKRGLFTVYQESVRHSKPGNGESVNVYLALHSSSRSQYDLIPDVDYSQV